MLRTLTSTALILWLGLNAMPSLAQATDAAISAPAAAYLPTAEYPNVSPDYCIDSMSGFPTDDQEARYQFFRLTEEMARDITPDLRRALSQYGEGQVPLSTPMLDVIEDIANPVLRQAAPEITITNMTYVIDFASICEPFITGQINSLKAYDSALSDTEFNSVIAEDALFLRQILSDSMYRLGANEDPIYQAAVTQYADSLVATRDVIEFTSFESELDDLEALYMTDLDGRLKRSNDVINEEMDREILGDSIALSDSMNKAEKKKAKQRQLYTLIRILGGGG